MPQDKPLFQQHASRLFVAEGESYTAAPQTRLPYKPDEWRSGPQKGREHWNDTPCLVVLGEPGSGKSREFQHWRDSLREAGQAAFLIALRDCYDLNLTLPQLAGDEEDSLDAALNEPQATPLNLFLDALDEGRLHFPTVLQHLVRQLRTAQKIRPIQLRLSCRARDWQSWTDKDALAKLYPDRNDQGGVTVIEILPLDSSAIYGLASEKLPDPARVNEFIGAARERKVMGLAGHPLTLGMMLEVFAADGRLGDNRTEIFQSACELLTKESNRLHGEKGKPLTTEADRLEFAKHLAALSVLSNLATIHIPDRDNPPQQSLDGTLVTGDKAKLHETLDCSLFTKGQPGSFRFLHPLLADFLAARWVAERIEAGLRPRAVLPLFNAGEAGIPTPLRNFAAWLACFNPQIRQLLLSTDPATLMRGDVGILSPQDRTALIQALTDRYAQRDFQREVDSFADLAGGVEAEVLKDLLKPSRSLAVRHMALEIALSGKRQDIAAEAWAIGANPKEDQTLRQRAVRIVCELAPAEYASQLVSLLDCPFEEDPDDELAGIVLHRLFPKYLRTEQALLALREPRDVRLIGSFEGFWREEFLQLLPQPDEALVLNSLFKQLASIEGFAVLDPREAIYLNLLSRRLSKHPFDSINQIALWISPLCINGGLESHYESNDSRKLIHSAIADNPKLKQGLIEYDIASYPNDKPYEVWRTPFPSECFNADDFEWLAELCNQDGLKDEVRLILFLKLNSVFSQGKYKPIDRMEDFIRLAENHPCLERDWPSWLICNLEDEWYKQKIKAARKRIERDAEKIAHLLRLTAQIPRLEKGLEPEIFEAVHEQSRFSHIGTLPDLIKLAEATTAAFASAASQGFQAVWDTPPPEATDWNHPEGSISCWLIAASYGLELNESENPIHWENANEAQLGAASIIALRYALNATPSWFVRLYETYPERINPRLNDYLAQEARLSPESFPSITAKLTRAAESSPILATNLLNWFLQNAIPNNLNSLEYFLRLALKQPKIEFKKFIAKRTPLAMSHKPEDSPAEPRRASLLLATWWLMDWQAAQKSMEAGWFSNTSLGYIRIRAFIDGLRAVAELHGLDWPTDIPFQAHQAIAPWLYLEQPENPQKIQQRPIRIVSSRNILGDARKAVLNAIVSGPTEPARDALKGFLKLPQFESEYQTILHYLSEIERRMVDERWLPTNPNEVKQVLSRSARIVRSVEEFYWLAEDICDTDLREALRCDVSLVPLLWVGTKKDQSKAQQDKQETKPKQSKSKTDARNPAEEKPLQAILINQLFLLLKGTPLLHAREPESFDAKKEDCRLQVSLSDNLKALIAIEIKQAKHTELWTAARTQLVDKYMKEHNARFGLYLVGWYGAGQLIVAMPGERMRKQFNTAMDLEIALQKVVNQDLIGTDKRVKVIVYDCTV